MQMADSVMTDQLRLTVVLLPDHGYGLEWERCGPDHNRTHDHVEQEQRLYDLYRESSDSFLLALATSPLSDRYSDSVRYLQRIGISFIREAARHPHAEQLGQVEKIALSDEQALQWCQASPYLIGGYDLEPNFVHTLWQSLHRGLAQSLQAHAGTIADWFAQYVPDVQRVGRVYFHLVESKEGEEYPFSFLATYAAGESTDGKTRHVPLQQALQEYGEHSAKLLELLSAVYRAAEHSELLRELLASGDLFYPIGLTAEEAYTFLRETMRYEEAGVLCRIPKWWRNKSASPKLNIQIGERQAGRLNGEALLSFQASLLLGEAEMTAAELKQLLAEQEGLALFKGRWVEVNHKQLQQALDAYEQATRLAETSGISLREAMQWQMQAEQRLALVADTVEVEVSHGEWLDAVMKQLRQPDRHIDDESEDVGEHFQADLRVYQRRGVQWLSLMASLGLGACLADDMGLGKTVQVLALLNRHRGSKQALLVVPASLLGNWVSELQRFAPELRYVVCHPSVGGDSDEGEALVAGKHTDLVMTTYGMLGKYEWLQQRRWDMLILDEAQAIKNASTQQTKRVKQVQANFRLAMTGTPIENRLGDLWSLFDFLNKGMLGTAREFTLFTKQMRETTEGYARLRQVVSPFILRRLKTDRSIISDLPDKIEMKTYAGLSKRQVVLYSKQVQELQERLASADEGIKRRGLVLAALMKFKQICNHPDQYLGQQMYTEKDSGKFVRLREIAETIHEKRERVLVFTQFKEMTEPLRAFLETIFGHPGLVLHGETAVRKRKEIVDVFQAADYVPFLVLSIKAGGVGLNLTAANHVVHFDRWWNPAVENQATDRAFRIGQQKNVVVHKFITTGTIEEKIDQLIADKTKLSTDLVPDVQENWITEMDNEQLLSMMRLS